jgi:hypothetical protein
MGLDTSHNAFHGAYSTFNKFRKFLAEEVLGGKWPHWSANDPIVLPEKITPSDYPGLYLFFWHSDCEGHFTPHECTLVANDLEKLLPDTQRLTAIPNNEESSFYNFAVLLQKFIDGCRLAASRNEFLDFH